MANTTFQGADIVSPRETLFEQVRYAGYPRGPTSAADLRLSANFRPCSHREAFAPGVTSQTVRLRPLFAQGDHFPQPPSEPDLPSTPVRTGRPVQGDSVINNEAFDPRSHRETAAATSQA